MPLTFVSHQAPVVPLKIWRPHWFDGTALVTGSMAPDFLFVTNGTVFEVDGHTWPGVVAAAVLAVALAILIKRVIAAPLASALPDAGGFHLRDYALLAAWPIPANSRGWAKVGASAIMGLATHLIWDSFTHGHGWAVQHLDWLQASALDVPANRGITDVHLYDLLQLVGTGIGLAITIWSLWWIGTHRLLVDWYPDMTPDLATNRIALATATLTGALAGIAISLVTLADGMQTAIMRTAAGAFIGLLVGCLLSPTQKPKPN